MNKISSYLLLSLPLIHSFGQESNPNKPKPNIIFIMTDDVAYGDVSCYGGIIPTPAVDKLASEGIRFTNAYSVASTSSPSRYSLLTGEYAFRKNVGILPGNAPMTIDANNGTLPVMLQKAGYHTACIGKWHLGLGDGNLNYNTLVKPSPNDIGFDYSFIIPATNDRVPCVYLENGRVVGLDPTDPIEVSYSKRVGNWPTGDKYPEKLKLQVFTRHHKGTIVDSISRIGYMTGGTTALWKDEDMNDVITNQAVEYIRKNADKPFFLFFATHTIHEPRVASPRSKGKSGHGVYGDVILDMDWSVAQIIDALKEMNIDQNTLVVFMSDNGPMVREAYDDKGLENLNGHYPEGPLRGGKYSLYEGGTRLPFIVWYPSKVKPKVSDAIVSQIDIYASMAKLTKTKLKIGEAPDSRNALSVLKGKTNKTKHNEVLIQNNGGFAAIRVGKWKFIPANPNWKNSVDELYNLETDIAERINLANAYPEIADKLRDRISDIKR